MKYELIKTDISKEYPVMVDTIEVVDKVETVTGQTESEDEYFVNVTLAIRSTDGIVPDFSKDITVTSNNAQTGFAVDIERAQAIEAFMKSINS